MKENFREAMLRMRAAGFKVVLHPEECGPCRDCRRLIDTVAGKIREEEDRQVMYESTKAV